jgi:hypothetical protein
VRSFRASAVIAVSLLAASVIGAWPDPARAATALAFPAPAGTEWAVLAGYNTVTHSQADGNDPWALDLQRVDAPTDGSIVLAPLSGTVSYVSSSCVTIRDTAGTRVMMCHILAPQSLRNTSVSRGQQIGTVAPAGQAGNNGVAHIHFALSNAAGSPLPFTGAYAIEGVELPPTDQPNAYAGVQFRSTIVPGPAADAGPDQTVRPRAGVMLSGSGTSPTGSSLRYQWTQVNGPSVVLSTTATTVTSFAAPSSSGTLEFRFIVTDDSGDSVSDTVTVRVSSTVTVAATLTPTRLAGSSTPTASGGRLISGSVPLTGGFGIVVFGGGTSEQLLAASNCPIATSAFWTSTGGGFIVYVPGTTVTAVNQAWRTHFAAGIPSNTALIGKCR